MSTEQNTVENQIEEELSPIEEKAMERGWKPQEEFEGNPDDWVDAKEFVARGELMDTIHQERRARKKVEEELTTVKSTVTEIKGHYEKMAKLEIEKTIKELKAQKREALRVDDLETADDIDDQLSQIKTEKQKLEEAEQNASNTQTPAPLPPEVQEWISKNPWADENSSKFQADLAEEALFMLQGEVARTGDRSTGSLDRVKAKMEKLYPDRFTTKTRASTSVDSTDISTKSTSGGGSFARKMSPDQRMIGQKFVDLGTHKSLEEYAKELHKMGEL